MTVTSEGNMTQTVVKIVMTAVMCVMVGGCGSSSGNDATAAATYTSRLTAFAAELVAPGSKMIIGDSITQLWPDDLMPTGWINRGISADTTAGVLNRLASHISEKPAAIALFIGTNDLSKGLTSTTTANYRQIIDRIRQDLPGTRIYIISILPRSDEYDSFVGPMNNSIRDVAESYGIPWINAHDRFESNGSINAAYFMDGLHPNRTGYQVLHDVVAVELAR
jgi:hypothetical protein